MGAVMDDTTRQTHVNDLTGSCFDRSHEVFIQGALRCINMSLERKLNIC